MGCKVHNCVFLIAVRQACVLAGWWQHSANKQLCIRESKSEPLGSIQVAYNLRQAYVPITILQLYYSRVEGQQVVIHQDLRCVKHLACLQGTECWRIWEQPSAAPWRRCIRCVISWFVPLPWALGHKCACTFAECMLSWGIWQFHTIDDQQKVLAM